MLLANNFMSFIIWNLWIQKQTANKFVLFVKKKCRIIKCFDERCCICQFETWKELFKFSNSSALLEPTRGLSSMFWVEMFSPFVYNFIYFILQNLCVLFNERIWLVMNRTRFWVLLLVWILSELDETLKDKMFYFFYLQIKRT